MCFSFQVLYFLSSSRCFIWVFFIFIFISFFFLFFFCLFRAALMAYGGSQARGCWIRIQLPTYTIAEATRDLSCICNLHHSSWQCCILNALSEARDRACIFTDTSQVRFSWAMRGTPESFLNLSFLLSSCLCFLYVLVLMEQTYNSCLFILVYRFGHLCHFQVCTFDCVSSWL